MELTFADGRDKFCLFLITPFQNGLGIKWLSFRPFIAVANIRSDTKYDHWGNIFCIFLNNYIFINRKSKKE